MGPSRRRGPARAGGARRRAWPRPEGLRRRARPRRAGRGQARAPRRPLAGPAGPAGAGLAARPARADAGDGSTRRAPRCRRPSTPAAPCSRPSATSGCWSRRRVDVTLPCDRQPARRPAPDHHARSSGSPTSSSRWARRSPRGPRSRRSGFNFDALNIPPDHPARTMQDTFYVGDAARIRGWCCAPTPRRCRSAPCSTREPPIYVVCPAGRSAPTSWTPPTPRCSTRSRAWPSTRASRWPTSRARSTTSRGRCSARRRRTRLRPSLLPVHRAVGRGRRVVPGAPKGGAALGRVGRLRHGQPGVLRACGIDPEVYSGFAFGMGIERTLMFRNGVPDMRDMVEGDVRFTRAFGMEVPEMRLSRCRWLREYVDLPGGPDRRRPGRRRSIRRRPRGRGRHRPRRRRSPGPLVVGRVARDRGAHRASRSRSAAARSTSASQRHGEPRGIVCGAPTSPSATWSWSRCPAPCCPAASRSPPARPTGTSPTA